MKKFLYLTMCALVLQTAGCKKDDPAPDPAPSKVEKPVITASPASSEVVLGETATFSVAATGSRLIYQWYKNGSPLSEAATANLSVKINKLSDAGEFHCTVSNEGGSATSEKATVDVKSSFSWNSFKLSLGNVDWRVRTTSAPETEVEFYNPATGQWYLLTWSGGTEKGVKTNAKLILSSPEGSEEEIVLTSFEVVETHNGRYHAQFRSGNVSGELVRPVAP
ncbi:MAG: immunoglobulin domain-containing protein [Bacteroidales bacterium]|jgi:hypothetical protein|nr:immunoglobulin domain-containing protein [Bacteroidales bacterium]